MPANDRCARCGIQALEGQVFHPENFVFRRMRWYCPNCHARRHRLVNTAMLAATPLLGVAGAVLKSLNPESDFGSLLINLFLMQLFLAIGIVPHELGHGLAGRLCGLDVRAIVVGSGPTIFLTRIFGIPTEFKLLPIAGVALAQPTQVTWLRTRWFMFVAAGPMANALAILCAHFVFGVPLWSASLLHAGPAGLFVFANWIHVVVNLVPFMTHTNYGRMPNDGLSLLQLIFLRRLPFVPPQKPTRGNRLLAWIGALLLWSLAVLCFVLAWFVMKGMPAPAHIKTFLLFLFGGMGASLLWFGYRAAFSQPAQRTIASSYPQQVFMQEIQQNARVCLRHPLAAEYQSHLAAKNWAEMEKTLLRICPPESNAYAAAAVGDCREATGDYAGAAQMYALAETLLSSESAVWLKIQRVKMLLRLGDISAATELGRTIVNSLNGASKLAALDCLACLPIMENLKSFLPVADEFSREALEIQPQNFTLKGTRGAILVELGRIDEAEPMLNEVYTTSEADHDQRISAFYLGLIAKTRGDLKRARAFAVQCIIYPEKWLTERTQKELLS